MGASSALTTPPPPPPAPPPPPPPAPPRVPQMLRLAPATQPPLDYDGGAAFKISALEEELAKMRAEGNFEACAALVDRIAIARERGERVRSAGYG